MIANFLTLDLNDLLVGLLRREFNCNLHELDVLNRSFELRGEIVRV